MNMLETSSLHGWIFKGEKKEENNFVFEIIFQSFYYFKYYITFIQKRLFLKRGTTHFFWLKPELLKGACSWIRSSLTIGDGSLLPWNSDPRLLGHGVFEVFKRRNRDIKTQVKCSQVSKRIKSCKGKELISLQLGNVSPSIIIISSCYPALFDNDEQS